MKLMMLHVDVDYGFGLYLFGHLHEWLEIGCWFYYSTITSIEDKPLIAYSHVDNYSIDSIHEERIH